MNIVLETERLQLRRFTETDVDNLVNLDSDPEVMRYLNGGVPTPREVVESVILPRFLRYYEHSDRCGWWAAIERSTDSFVGWFSLHPKDEGPPDVAELGYRLRKAAWGRGYATEGVLALIRKGFTECGMRRVQATTYQDNVPSRRVMEKAGMKLVGAYRPTLEDLNATFTWVSAAKDIWDGEDVIYTLEKTEWERQNATAWG